MIFTSIPLKYNQSSLDIQTFGLRGSIPICMTFTFPGVTEISQRLCLFSIGNFRKISRFITRVYHAPASVSLPPALSFGRRVGGCGCRSVL